MAFNDAGAGLGGLVLSSTGLWCPGAVSVYNMRMARVNVYLPDDLAAEAKAVGLNVSNLTQEALRSALAASRVDEWLDNVTAMRPLNISHHAVTLAVTAAKDELEDHG